MNNTFDINRLGLLIRKHWLEYGKLYLIVLGIVAGILGAIYGYIYWDIIAIGADFGNLNLQLGFRWPLFAVFGILFLTLAANHYFAPLGQKPKAILELTLPASSLEKFLVGILFSSVLALLSYLLIFYLVDFAFVSKLRSQFPKAITHNYVENPERILIEQVPQYFFARITKIPSIQLSPFAGSMLLSSLFLLGSLFFKKFQYIKTVITTLVFGGVWLTFVINSQEFIFNNKISTSSYNQHVSQNVLGWGFSVFLLVLTIIFYTIAYIRFKEKEV